MSTTYTVKWRRNRQESGAEVVAKGFLDQFVAEGLLRDLANQVDFESGEIIAVEVS